MMSHVVCVSAVEVRSIWASRWSLIHLWGTAGASPLTWKHVRCTLNVLSHMFRASENFLAVLDDIKFWMMCEICIVYKRLVWPTRAKRIWIVTMKQFLKNLKPMVPWMPWNRGAALVDPVSCGSCGSCHSRPKRRWNPWAWALATTTWVWGLRRAAETEVCDMRTISRNMQKLGVQKYPETMRQSFTISLHSLFNFLHCGCQDFCYLIMAVPSLRTFLYPSYLLHPITPFLYNEVRMPFLGHIRSWNQLQALWYSHSPAAWPSSLPLAWLGRAPGDPKTAQKSWLLTWFFLENLVCTDGTFCLSTRNPQFPTQLHQKLNSSVVACAKPYHHKNLQDLARSWWAMKYLTIAEAE